MTKSEAQTRSELIDQDLAQSGWNVKDPTQRDYQIRAIRSVGLRLDKIEKANDSGHADIAQREIVKLRLQIAALPKESIVIKEAAGALAKLEDENFWISLNHGRLEFLRAEIKPLFRTVSEADFKAMRFERYLLEYSLAKVQSGIVCELLELKGMMG
jgi:hypothetical protein